MNSRMLKLKDININIREQGKGEVILFCHGFPETSYAWRHQLHAVAEAGYHGVAMDMRGYGRSSAPLEIRKYSLDKLVEDVIGVIDALECEKVILAGNDWGSTVVWQTALLHPDRLKGIIPMGVPMMGRSPVKPTDIFPQTGEALFYTLYFQQPGLAEMELERDIPATLKKIYYAASGEAGPREDRHTPNPFGMVSRTHGLLAALPDNFPSWLTENDMEEYVNDFAFTGFQGGLNYYRNLDANWAAQKDYENMKITVPALYMAGQRDTGFSIPGMDKIIEAMPALVPGLRKPAIIPGAGHWLPQEAPEEVNKELLEFIKSL